MNFFTNLLQLLDTQMQTPALYGPYHLICLMIVAALSVLLALRSKKMHENTVNTIVLVTAIVTIALEIYKQINYTFGDGSEAAQYQWYAFPWQFCSTPMYIGLLAGLLRKGRLYDALCSYLATFALFAGLVVMFYPGDVFTKTVGINIQTIVCHGGMVVIGVLLIASGKAKLEWKTLLKGASVFAVMVLLAVAMNEIAYRLGLEDFNMFYVSPHCDPHLPVYSMVQGVLPFPWCLVVYVLGFTAAAGIVLAAAMGIRRLGGQRKTVLRPVLRLNLK